MRTFGKTRIGAGGILCLINNYSMRKHINRFGLTFDFCPAYQAINRQIIRTVLLTRCRIFVFANRFRRRMRKL